MLSGQQTPELIIDLFESEDLNDTPFEQSIKVGSSRKFSGSGWRRSRNSSAVPQELMLAERLMAKKDDAIEMMQKHGHHYKIRMDAKVKQLQTELKQAHEKLEETEKNFKIEAERRARELIVTYIPAESGTEKSGPEARREQELAKERFDAQQREYERIQKRVNMLEGGYNIFEILDNVNKGLKQFQIGMRVLRDDLSNVRTTVSFEKVRHTVDINVMLSKIGFLEQSFVHKSEVGLLADSTEKVFQSTALFLPSVPGFIKLPNSETLSKKTTHSIAALDALSTALTAYAEVSRSESLNVQLVREELEKSIEEYQQELNDAMRELVLRRTELVEMQKRVDDLHEINNRILEELAEERNRASEIEKELADYKVYDEMAEADSGTVETMQVQSKIAWHNVCNKSLNVNEISDQMHKELSLMRSELVKYKRDNTRMRDLLVAEKNTQCALSEKVATLTAKLRTYKDRLKSFKEALDDRERLLVEALKQPKVPPGRKPQHPKQTLPSL